MIAILCTKIYACSWAMQTLKGELYKVMKAVNDEKELEKKTVRSEKDSFIYIKVTLVSYTAFSFGQYFLLLHIILIIK